jgi:hypothetical protein
MEIVRLDLGAYLISTPGKFLPVFNREEFDRGCWRILMQESSRMGLTLMTAIDGSPECHELTQPIWL